MNEITDAASALATMKAEIERLRQQLDQKDAVGPTLQASEEMQQLQVGLEGTSQAGGQKRSRGDGDRAVG